MAKHNEMTREWKTLPEQERAIINIAECLTMGALWGMTSNTEAVLARASKEFPQELAACKAALTQELTKRGYQRVWNQAANEMFEIRGAVIRKAKGVNP